jgi:uncharacterized protein (DUF362 family)
MNPQQQNFRDSQNPCTGHSPSLVSRRKFIWSTAGLVAASKLLLAEEPSVKPAARSVLDRKSTVSLSSGMSRRENVCQSLVAIEDQIMPVLKSKKSVVIKPNIVNTMNQLASTHVDALQGILDFLAPRFKGPVVIAESSAGISTEGYDHFRYRDVISEHKPLPIDLVDLNEEGKYKIHTILDGDLHAVPVRLAARLLDPEAYVICCAILKTHNTVLATMSIKNMCLGAPLHSPRAETSRWNDKRLYHGGVRQTHLDIMLTAQKLQPFWGATVIDGFEGMEGNGPNDGTPVPSRLAIASTDYIAADRVGIEAIGLNAAWVAYLGYCAQSGLGQDDLSKIEIRGAKLADVTRKYRMHTDLERELKWMGPMKEIPEKLG